LVYGRFKKLSSKRKFCENKLDKVKIYLGDVNEFLTVLPTFIFQLGEICYSLSTRDAVSSYEFVKTDAAKAVRYLKE
jgi:hypothetical protein